MESLFNGYYEPSEEELDDIWGNGIFCFDANVLLNLYRYSPETKKQFLKTIRVIKDRIWLPHQAAFEYQNNRLREIWEQKEVYNKISRVLSKSQQDLFEDLGGDHLSLDGRKILDIIVPAFDKAKKQLDKAQEHHPDLLETDSIRKDITNIFKNKVGEPYDEERLEEIYKEGQIRYEKKVPPGYKDNQKNDCKYYGTVEIKSRYGDLIIWKQMIDKAKSGKVSSFFITDDKKEDWWNLYKGRTIGPRPELLTEFTQETGQTIYFLKPNYFLEQAKERYNVSVTEKTLDEVKAVSKVKIDWKELIIEAFQEIGGDASLSSIYDEVGKSEVASNFPDSWQSCVRKALYHHSSDVELYTGKEDLFKHISKGVWGLRHKQ